MNEMKLWFIHNVGMKESDFWGVIIIMSVCAVICLITYMKKRAGFLTGCIVRMGIGTGLIFLANYLFQINGVALSVGIGPISILTSAILGIPGVCLLYGILLI